jgi:uncharacterized protein YihD (DUF1040 family)
MRDKKRIKRILKKVEKIWMYFPDLRLGQLIQNWARENRDSYYLEDNDLEEQLDLWIKNNV